MYKTSKEHEQTAWLYLILFLISLAINVMQWKAGAPAREDCAREAEAVIREWKAKGN